MALSASKLAAQLQIQIGNTVSPSTAITNITNAFDTYIMDAVANSISIVRPSTAKADMQSAMAALNTSNQGAAAIAAGVTAYWNDIISQHSSTFPTSTAVVAPSGIASLASALQATFNSNAAVNLTGLSSAQISAAVATMLTNIANTIHAACIGPTPGTVTVPPGTIGPIT